MMNRSLAPTEANVKEVNLLQMAHLYLYPDKLIRQFNLQS